MKTSLVKFFYLFTILLIYNQSIIAQCGVQGLSGYPASSDCYPNTTNSYRIPVYFHIVDDSNSPTVDMNQINSIIQELNTAHIKV